MKNTGPDILELIPQRPPMVMINHLLSVDGAMATGSLEVEEDNVFVYEGILTESGMIEAIAQTAAARTGWIAFKKTGTGEKKIPVGVIGSVKDFQLSFYPKAGEKIEMEVEVLHEFMNASVIRGKVRVNENEACMAELKIFLTE